MPKMSDESPGLRFTEPIGSGTEWLVLGHSLGTSSALWGSAIPRLRSEFRMICWELPGHGAASASRAPFSIEDVSDAIVARADDLGIETFHHAGVSIGGCVGLDLARRHAGRVTSSAIISAGARVDDPDFWLRRAAAVRAAGTASLVEACRQRWFAPGSEPALVEEILGLLRDTDAEGYALAAEALSAFDVWEELPRITTPILAIAGEADQAVPVERSRELAERVRHGRLVRVPHAAHCIPAEQPALLAAALREFLHASIAG